MSNSTDIFCFDGEICKAKSKRVIKGILNLQRLANANKMFIFFNDIQQRTKVLRHKNENENEIFKKSFTFPSH